MFRLSQVAWLAAAACGNEGVPPCPGGYLELPDLDSCYRAEVAATTWVLARAACDAEGAHLAIPDGGYEALSISTVAMNAGFTVSWVGINDLEVEDEFVNVLGERQTFLPWNGASDEPNGGTSENCVRINSVGALVDVECTSSLIFVCELPR